VSEFEPEGGDFGELGGEEAGEFLVEPFDVTQLENATPVRGRPLGEVTSRFFAPDGTPLEAPAIQTVAGFLSQLDQDSEQEAQVPWVPDATSVEDPGAAGPDVAGADLAVGFEAWVAEEERANEARLVDRVGELGARKEFGVRDPAALEAAAAAVSAEVDSWWRQELARGATARQGAELFQSPEYAGWVDGLISERLREARYLSVTRTTSMAKWRDAALAEGAEMPIDRHPSLQRMAVAWEGASRRQAAQQAALAAIRQRSEAASLAQRPERWPKLRKMA
jgi:hypothetical protein